MRKFLVGVAALALAALAVIPAAAQTASRSIVDIVVADNRFDTLQAAVIAAGLDDDLAGAGPFTVFAPTDNAFAALPDGLLDALLADPAALADVLRYHVVSGAVPASTVVTLNSATTLLGEPVYIEVTDDGVVLNAEVNVIVTDVRASNGIIHVIDAVLIPPLRGLNNQLFIQADTPVFSAPTGGVATGNVLRAGQTFEVSDIVGGFARLAPYTGGGWIRTADTSIAR